MEHQIYATLNGKDMLKKGKNFSANNASGKRKESDYYPTAFCLTRTLLDVWNIERSFTILEPCCGEANAIVKVLEEYNFQHIISHDLNVDGIDFLQYHEKVDYLITNPPYSLSQQFIKKAKEVADKEFAMLLPLSYLHGKKRYDEVWLDKKFPLKKVYVFTRYPMFDSVLREDGKINTGMVTFAWFVWDKNYKGNPELDWIDINQYIISKKEK